MLSRKHKFRLVATFCCSIIMLFLFALVHNSPCHPCKCNHHHHTGQHTQTAAAQ